MFNVAPERLARLKKIVIQLGNKMGWWMLNNGMVNWDGKMARNCQKISGFEVSRRLYRDPWHAQESLDGQSNLEGIHMCQNWCTCWTCKWLVVYRIWNFWNHPNSWVAILLRGILIISLYNCIYIYKLLKLAVEMYKILLIRKFAGRPHIRFFVSKHLGLRPLCQPTSAVKNFPKIPSVPRKDAWTFSWGQLLEDDAPDPTAMRCATSVKGATRQGIPE